MNTQESLFFILQLATGLFWILTYILIIKRGFQDKTFGMPMAAICANISWEFIFSFVYCHEGIQAIINIIWFSLDIIIMLQYLIWGWKDFKKYMPVKYFLPAFFLGLGVSFFIIIGMTLEFQDFQGKYSAFSQNLMMSILFISLLVKRGNLSGQSIYIAIFKMLGSLFAAVGFYIYFRANLITILSIATLIFDWIYIILVYKKFYKTQVSF